ncbi:DNA/RNA nuclease SfsA, partial [Pseudomonas frederiksbergensis]|nr:DNA/RNA nuclease SfsA [Pseudomonas frederiksbergensis]
MRFSPTLETARLLRRYKRFLADIELANGEQMTIHCPNTGSMFNCMVEGGQVWFSR